MTVYHPRSAIGKPGAALRHYAPSGTGHDLAFVLTPMAGVQSLSFRLAQKGEIAKATHAHRLPGPFTADRVLQEATARLKSSGYILHDTTILSRIFWEPALSVGTSGKKAVVITVREHLINTAAEAHVFRLDQHDEAHAYAERLRRNIGAARVIDRSRVTLLEPRALLLPRTEDPMAVVRKKLIAIIEEDCENIPRRFAAIAGRRNLMTLDDEAFADVMSAALRRLRGVIDDTLEAVDQKRAMSAHLRARIVRAMDAEETDAR